MKVGTFLAATGIIGVLFGLEFLLAPEFASRQYAPANGVALDPRSIMTVRFFGGALLAWGLIAWFSRHTRDAVAVKAVLLGSLIGDVIGAVLALWARLSGVQNDMAWMSVLIYGAIAAGSAYFLLAHRAPDSPAGAT